MKLRPILISSVFCLTAGCELPVSETKAIQLMSSTLPDGRREGMAALVTRFDDGKSPVFVSRYRQLAEHDPDYTVRAMAIRALNICRDKSSTPIFVAGLNDENESIRLESAKALANIPDRTAVPALVDRLNGAHPVIDRGETVSLSETRDVRIAAADALRHYKDLDVEHALADALAAPEFGIAWQAHQSLVTMTGKDLKYSEGAWLELLTKPG